MKDRVFKKLPAIHQTDVLDAFFKTTIDQWFTEAEIIDVEGYAGRKVPGLYSPTQDFYIAESSVTREHYQLEPTLVTNDINTAEVDAVLFYDDVLRQLHTEGANIYHHDSLFASNAFSWAPPIDLDKFINYENYYWYDYGAPAIAVLGTMSAPLNVETDIIGKTTFTSANGITLTNGMRIIFTGAYITPELYRKSKSDKEFIVEGVGTSIKLIDVKSDDFDHTLSYIIQESEIDHEWDTDFWDEVKWAVSVGTDGTELERRIDYVTIKRGAQNQNPWSRTNGWYHKDALMLVTGTATGEEYTTLEPRLWDDSDEVFDSEAWDATIKLHDELFSLDPARQAKRPIIEFDNNLELYDYGVEGLGSVTVACEDNYNTVHGATNPEVDGRVLEDNDTIIFLNTALLKQNPWDNDEWDPGSHPSGTQHPPGPYSAMPPGSIGNWDVVGALNATGIVYYVDINIFTGWCTLTEHKIVLSDQKVFVKAGIDYKGKEFWWDNDSWNLCQLKTKQNDEPLFHVYDANMNKLNSTYYPGSTSYGNKVFSYKESSSGVVDDYIGKSLEYKEFGQITDIVFVNNLEDAVSYESGQINGYKYLNQYHLADGPATLKEWGWDSNAWDYSVIEGSEEQQVILWDSGSLVHRNVEIVLVPPHNRISSTFINGWNETNQKSKQRVKETFTVETTGDSIFTLGSSPTVEVGLADIIVTVDGNVAKQSTSVLAHDYNIVGDVLTFTTNLQLTAGQVIDTRAVTIDIVDLLDKHYFEIPDNLEANPDNLDIVEASASELLDQFVSIIGNQEGIAGNSFGTNNYRDTIQDRSKGTKILQHDSSLLPLMHILSKRKDLKITESIRYNQTEYANFKSKFLQQVLFFASQVDTTVISEFVDDVLDTMYGQRSNLSIFAEVPAICYGNSYTAIEHHPSYPTTYFMLDELLSDVDIENRKRVVYIYYTSPHDIATGSDKTLLINDIDYKFVQVEDEIGNIVTKVEFTNTLDRNSKLEIRLFDDIQNAFIPLTPSMVGSHSVYVPKKEIDDTYIDGNKTFIIGHDGSRILEFGDVRDDALIELEKRIFNSIPVKYTWEYLPELNYFDIMPGKYRTTSYTMFDVNIVMEPMLRRWGLEHSVDFHTHRTYDESLPFTWNYVTELDLDGKEVPGSWRGIYMYYYDTVRPHTHPWEMLGFSIKPSWWDGEYGSAPYTSINTLLWNDLELGIIKQGVRANLAFDKWDSPDNKFKRPGLANVIPVDLFGNLLDPVKAGIFGNPITSSPTLNGVISIAITSSGSNYTTLPVVSVTPAVGDITGGGTTASVILNNKISGVTVISDGTNYTLTPTVVITPDVSDPNLSTIVNATATAIISTIVDSITITYQGIGYTTVPTVTITGGGGAGATAVATIGTDYWAPDYQALKEIVITNNGTGYTSAPTVTITGGGYTTIATATAIIDTVVTSIVVNTEGSGYTFAPTVTVVPDVSDPNLSTIVSATATATISGSVQEINIINSGSAYTLVPVVTITGGGGTGATAVATLGSGTSYYLPNIVDRHLDWQIGDLAPVEYSARGNVDWPFILNKLFFLFKPAEYVTKHWDTLYIGKDTANSAHTTFKDTRKRNRLQDYRIQSATTPVYGLQSWLKPYTISQGKNYTTLIGDTLATTNVALGYKAGGFVSSNLKVIADSFSSLRTTENVFIPDENKIISLYDGFSQGIRAYSGVIVTVTESGFEISGFDQYSSVFSIIPSIQDGPSTTIVIDNMQVNRYDTAYDVIREIPYGYSYDNFNDVFDFLISYGRYLAHIGFVFDEFDHDTGTLLDFEYSAKEFMGWVQLAPWEVGSFLALSPVAGTVKFNTAGVGDVANLTDIINNTYTVLDKDKKQIPTQDIVITRKADTFVVSTVANTGIYGLKLNPYKTEHVITFNNITDFNDLIYDPLLRLRQDRMKLNIKKTGNWNGKYEAPGYIIKSNDIIPNFDTTANNYRKYFDDTDTPLSQSLTDTGRHLIGYQTRDYLDNITENEDISFQFYKGMLLQKGNEQSLTKLLRSNRLGNEDITFYEEFAFKIGELGATDLQTQIEIALRTADVRVENPVIELTYDDNIIDTLNDDITQINYYNDSRWIEKPEMPLTTVWPTLPVGYTGDNWLPSAGYVHNDDIKYRAFDPATLASLNTVSRDTAEPQLGELAHIAKTYNDQFGVFKLVDTGLKVESAELLDTGKTRVSVIGEIIPTIVGNSSLISPDISSVASRTPNSPLTANASDITTARIGDEINIELNGGEKAGGSNFKILLGTASLVADSDPTVTFNTSRVSSITKDTSIFINDVEVIFAKIPPGPFSKICRVINPKIKLTNACTINSTPIIFVANDQLTTPGESTDTGKLQAGATSAITLAKGANITHNFYKNQTVEIISGTGIGQVRTIIDYRGDTKVAEVDTAWNIQPDDTSGYTITIKGWPGGIIANINANIFGVDAYDMNGYLLLKSPAASLTFNAHHSTVNTDIGLAEGIHHNEMSVIEILDAINTTFIPDIFATIENNNNNIAVTGIGINKVECRRGTGNAHQVLFPSKTSGVDVTTNKVVADNRLITLDDVIADIEAAGLPDGFTAIKDLDGNIKFTYNGNSMHVSGSALSGIGMQSTAMVITTSSVVKHMFKHGDAVVLTDILTKKGELLDINAGQLIEEETVYIHKTVDIVNGIVTIFDLITNESTVLTDVNKIPIYTINVADRDYVENFAISIVAPVAPSEISVGDSKVKDSILPAFVNKDAKGYSTGKIGPYATLFENEGTINIFSHSHNNFISGNFTVSMTVKKKGIFIIDDLMMTELGLLDTTSDNIKYWHPRRFNTKADAVSDVREYRSFYDIGDIVWVDNEDSGYIVGKVKDLQNHYALTATMLTSSGHGYTPDDIGRNFTINTYDTETITPPVCEITNIDFGIGSVTVTEGGAGYTSPPMVTFTGVDTTKPASAVAVLATEILSINITNPGGGYKTIPLVEIYESPIYNGAIWNVEHNLGQQLVNLEISDYEHNVVNFVYEGPTITYVDENNLTIDWHGEVTVGYIDVIKSEYFSSLFIEENTWLVYHNLGQQYVTVDIIYGDFTGLPGRFDHPIIEYTTANMLRVIFPKNVTASGYVAATFCDGNDIVNDGHVHTASAASNVWNVTHNLGKRHVNIDVAFAGSDIEFFDVGNLTTVAHNLHSRCVNIELVDADNKVIYNTYNPTIVEFVDDDSFELISGARSVERVNVIKPRYISPVQSVIAFVDANTLRLPAQSVVAVTKVNIIKSNFVSSLQPASNVWTVAHGLGQAIVNIDIIYADDSSARSTYNQPIVEYFDPNTVRIIFPTDVSASGYVVASHCNTTNTSGTGYDHDESAAPATTWTVAHNLGSKYVNVDIAVLGTSIQSADVTASIDSAKYYNIKSLYDYPVIKYIDANNLTITFSSATAGKAVISGGTTITPSGTSATHIIHGLGQQYVNFELVSNADEVVHNVYNQGTDKWVINHNLNKTITNVDIIYNDYKSANSKFDHPLVEYTNSNTVTILFPEGVARDGYVAISHNDSNSATPGFGYEHTETTAATVWNVAHNLGSIYANVDIAVPGSAIDFTYRDFIIDILHSLSQRLVNIEFIDANNKVVNNVYDQTKIECVDTDNLRAYISGNTSISKINIVPSNFVSSLQPASNVWTVSHSLATDIVNVDVIYDDYTIAKATYDQPIIEYTDDNNVKVIFPTGIQQAGYVAVGGGGGTGTGTNVINFDVEWITAQTGQLNPVTSTHPWTVSSDNLTIRYDVEDSLNCGGSNEYIQTGTADATITIGAVDVNMKLDFEGVGEMEHPDFEKITFKLDGTVIADAHAAGGGLGCTMGPVVKSGSSAQATADVIVQGDQVVHVFVLQGGAGYDPQAAPPTVTISAPTSGVTATAEAMVDPTGSISGYFVTNPGSGYTFVPTPTVTIDPPPPGGYVYPLYLPLLAGTTHVLSIDFTTNDGLYHVGAYYEAQLEFEAASTGGGGGAPNSGTSYLHTEATAATTWTVAHNLGSMYVNVDIAVLGTSIQSTDVSASIDPAKYYNIKGLYDYPVIEYIDANTLTITFSVATAGKVRVASGTTVNMPQTPTKYYNIKGLYNYPEIEFVDENNLTITFDREIAGKAVVSAGTTFAEFPQTAFYNIKGHYDFPIINYVDENQLTATFNKPQAGKLIVSAGEGIIDDDSVANVHMEVGTGAGISAGCPAMTIYQAGSGYSVSDIIIVEGGTGAAAQATVASVNGTGGVTGLTLTQGGDYTVLPLADACPTTVSPPGGNGLTLNLLFKVKSLEIVKSDYFQQTPDIKFTSPINPGGGGCTPERATATAVLSGVVTAVNIVDPGDYYSLQPAVVFTGGAGAGATATANRTGRVRGINIVDAGDVTFDYASTYLDVKPIDALDGKDLAASVNFEDSVDFDKWFSSYRTEEARINTELFDIATLYNKAEMFVNADLQLIDPIKGIISGLADTEIAYRVSRDPARYNITDDTSFAVNDDLLWDKTQAGLLWWDVSTMRYYDAEQGDNRYRRQYWNTLFPGSSIDIYEWIESTSPPSNYTGSGLPKSIYQYCQVEVWNNITNVFETRYYFWVKDTTIVPNVVSRSRSAFDVARYLTDLSSTGVEWMSPVSTHYEKVIDYVISSTSTSQELSSTGVLASEILKVQLNGTIVNYTKGTVNDDGYLTKIVLANRPVINDLLQVTYKKAGAAIIINNIDNLITADDSTLRLEYRTKETEINIHKQWILLRKNDDRSYVPDYFINKMVDSLVGYNQSGEVVPDTVLLHADKQLGTLYRPRQTWFKDIIFARKNFVILMNNVLVDLFINDDRTGWDTDEYNNQYITYVDVWSTGYSADTLIDYTVNDIQERDLLSGVVDEDIVKVLNDGTNRWRVYVYNATTEKFTKIGVEKQTVQLVSTLGTTASLTLDESNALRNLITTIFDKVFINELTVKKNEIFFGMVNYVLSEQNQVDWIFKSTYLNVSYAENDVQQQPKYKLDLLPNVQNYIEEVKPYTTKIREFRGIKNLKLETATAHTTDFDNPPYRDTDGQFGDVNDVVPLLTNTSPTYDLVLQTGVYKDYLDEHTNTNLLRSSTISIVFDRVGDNGVFAMSNAKTYQKNIEAWASDSRTTHYTIALTEGARLRAAILDLYGRVHIGDFTFGNATDRSVHRIVKYTTDLSQDLTQLATMTLAVTNEMKDHQVIITNEYHTLDTITYDQLIGADNHYTVTKGYFEDLNLTLVTAIQRYDYDINSVLRTGSNVAPGVPSEAQLQINAFILEYYNIQQRLIANYMNHVYAPVDEFGNVNHYSIDDANLFSLTPFQEDIPTPKEWGWDSNAWDHSVIEDSEEQQVILWDDGGKNEIVFVEFPNYSSETTFSNDRMGWHVYNSGNKSGVERVHYSSNYIYVVASSIPDHATDWYDPSWKYIQENNPNVILHQNKTWSIPLDVVVPTTPAETAETPGSNPIAILRNGIPLFNVKEQTSYWDEEVWHYNVGFQREAFVFGPDTIDEFYWQYRDNADGAVDYTGQYHYYTNPVAIYNDAPYEHSPLLGYAFDGVPIYGPRSYSNTDGTGEIRRLRSSYRLKTGARVAIGTELNVPKDNYDGTIIYDGSFIEDYEYVASLGDLDKHNGRFAITPEYPEGIYAYYVTVDDLNVPVYPYVIGPTYYGTPERSNYDITAPQVVEQSFLINDENEHGIPNLSIDRKERDAGTLVSLPTATDAEELIPVGSKEGLQITVQTNDHTDLASVTASVSFRIYYDADGETKYYALPDANKTTITSVVSRIDTEINVADVTVLPEPMKSSYDSGHSVPGVVFIGTERIEYFDIDVTNNKLLYCRRGTGTTSAEEHGISVSVFSGAVNNILTYEPEAVWGRDSYVFEPVDRYYVDADYVAEPGSGLLNSETVQATFFNNLPGQALHS